MPGYGCGRMREPASDRTHAAPFADCRNRPLGNGNLPGARGVVDLDGWPAIAQLSPNEVGDFLAGIFGPLALFWLILGFFLQREELRQSTRTLQLQAEELSKSSEQHAHLVQVAREEIELLKGDRAEQAAKKEPRFVFHSNGSSKDVSGRKMHVSAVNIGSDDAFNIRLSSQDVETPWSIHKAKIGGYDEFEFDLRLPRRSDWAEQLTLEVSFEREDGTIGNQRYLVKGGGTPFERLDQS